MAYTVFHIPISDTEFIPVRKFPSATRFEITENRELLVFEGADACLAAYAKDHWRHIVRYEETQS